MVTIDSDTQKININHNNEPYSYMFSDISFIDKVKPTYSKKNLFGTAKRRGNIWDNYGYIRIKFKDGKHFIFTSLMLDIDSFSIGEYINHYYSWYPYISTLRELNIQQYKKVVVKENTEKVDWHKNNFENFSTEKLQSKIDNPDRFEKEAIIAAKEIIEKRKESM